MQHDLRDGAVTASDRTAGPLSGVKVLEFAHVAAGPFAGMLLADMGADVVKIEPPSGDGLRQWPPITELSDGERFSLNFASLNRNKRSVVLDLKDEQDMSRATSLVAVADVVIENFRPGVMERLGLGFGRVSAEFNPDVIYCSISGYGSEGPYAQRGAFDLVIQAESGLMDITGSIGGDPVKCGVPVADFVTGQYAAFSVVCALAGRGNDHQPVFIDCSMLESTLAISALQTSQLWGTGRPPVRLGSAHPRNAPYQAFRAADRSFAMAAGNDRLWASVCGVVGDPGLASDPRFASQSSRVAHVDALVDVLETRFADNTARYWVDAFSSVGVPCSLVNDVAEALRIPQLEHRGFVQEVGLPDGRPTPATMMPVLFNGTNRFRAVPAPQLGEHNDEVLCEWLGRQPEDAGSRNTGTGL